MAEVTPELARDLLVGPAPQTTKMLAAAYLQVCEERDRLRDRVERAGPSLRLSTTRALLDELAHREDINSDLARTLNLRQDELDRAPL